MRKKNTSIKISTAENGWFVHKSIFPDYIPSRWPFDELNMKTWAKLWNSENILDQPVKTNEDYYILNVCWWPFIPFRKSFNSTLLTNLLSYSLLHIYGIWIDIIWTEWLMSRVHNVIWMKVYFTLNLQLNVIFKKNSLRFFILSCSFCFSNHQLLISLQCYWIWNVNGKSHLKK